ncbi:hypothetical protein [Crenobacter cavernae]|uniref:Uncharacterized protein n=1 Tax=Crenobacter cavernae TaxID=2290923 RepID=A0A345Y7E4_9NEIS|nr:hypothetical protein [Crenobacter cavernae]AXK39846.1 hypothetical protein DWG20_10560 [Crenobacter cavernae]
MGARVRTGLIACLRRHPLLTFGLMGAGFLGFGLATLNVIALLLANLQLVAEHGVMALKDGALRQFLELTGSGYFGLACYLGFKTCEKLLVDRLTAPQDASTLAEPTQNTD